ncbi:MAG: DoxX family protein [Chitinophagaceae bacterium]|nr:DoxX family protein [Chitinophagaceae bacterium]
MRKLFKRITAPIHLPFWWQDLILSLPRITGGYLMTVEFGAPKFGLPWTEPDNNLGFFEVVYWFPEDVSAYGGIFKAFPVFFAWMGAFSEGIGGIAWILGFQTRIFSFLLACTMAVAAFAQQWDNGLWSMLPALGFLCLSLQLMILGSGRFGLDYLLYKKLKP